DGMYEATAPDPDFAADVTTIQTGGEVNFEDLTTGNPLDWEWDFEGGTPNTFVGQEPPAIQYDTPGKYTVSLTSSNTIGSNTKDSVEMIIVGAPAADFSADHTYLMNGDTSNFLDESIGDPTEWYWEFPGGEPATSTAQNPENIIYSETGQYDVTLVAINEYGNDTLVKEEFITVGGPFAAFIADATNIVAGESVTFTDLSINSPTTWSWKFTGGSPGSFNGQVPPEITYNNAGNYAVKLTVSNDLGSDFENKIGYIQVGTIGIDEGTFDNDDVKVYPNPSSGIVNILFEEASSTIDQIKVVNAFGEEIYMLEPGQSGSQFEVDLSDQPNGVYFLNITIGDKVINEKVYIMK
ncbi:MAG: PKD domain-containing protein, partial [Bacteroidota bacterium]|nr:PKD domain-containing protein [Bacteroidota bacterium]